MTSLTSPTTFLFLLTVQFRLASLPFLQRAKYSLTSGVLHVPSPLCYPLPQTCVWLVLSLLPWSQLICLLIQMSFFDQPNKNNSYPFPYLDLISFIALNHHSEHCIFISNLRIYYLFNIFFSLSISLHWNINYIAVSQDPRTVHLLNKYLVNEHDPLSSLTLHTGKICTTLVSGMVWASKSHPFCFYPAVHGSGAFTLVRYHC